MERALQLAGFHHPHPNPRVGAVLVDPGGRVIGEGAHQRAGEPHAEELALAQAGDEAAGATMYVTLEPCLHQGRRPPCTKALIEAGVKLVVVGAIDPDQRMAGKGIERLRAAGIEVETGVLAERAEELDPAYFHHRRSGRPLVTLKAALTLDGQVAAADGGSQWITGEEARTDGHRLRAEADAVLIGAGTLLTDDPRLDVRLPSYQGHQPRPVVVAGRRQLPPQAQIFSRDPVVVTSGDWAGPGTALRVPAGDDGLPDLSDAIAKLGELGLLGILTEGGPTLASSLWRAGLIDRGVFYLAGSLAGGAGRAVFKGIWPSLEFAKAVEIVETIQLGPDLKVTFSTHPRDMTSREP
jgi:diaminohydroxyphosphoribosylaminopyrimidine deaminase/5-amino-6-(5-phosphoribosylamino)uracil reductase